MYQDFIVRNAYGPTDDPDVAFAGLVLSGDHVAQLAFAQMAFDAPRVAATKLAAYFDFVVVHHEGSDDARALDNFAFTGAADDLDAVIWYATQPDLSPSLRFAYAAIVAGAGQAAVRPVGWRDAA